MAGEGEIRQGGAATVLTCDNVLNLKGNYSRIAFGQETVFAAGSGATPYRVANGRIHERFRDFRTRRALDWRTAIRSMACT